MRGTWKQAYCLQMLERRGQREGSPGLITSLSPQIPQPGLNHLPAAACSPHSRALAAICVRREFLGEAGITLTLLSRDSR